MKIKFRESHLYAGAVFIQSGVLKERFVRVVDGQAIIAEHSCAEDRNKRSAVTVRVLYNRPAISLKSRQKLFLTQFYRFFNRL